MTKHAHKKLKTRRIRFEMPADIPKMPQEPFHNQPEHAPTIKNLGFTSYKSGSGKKKKKHLMDDLMEPLPQVETITLKPASNHTNTTPTPSASEETDRHMYPAHYQPPEKEPEEPEKPEMRYGMAFQALMRQGSGFTRKLYH